MRDNSHSRRDVIKRVASTSIALGAGTTTLSGTVAADDCLNWEVELIDTSTTVEKGFRKASQSTTVQWLGSCDKGDYHEHEFALTSEFVGEDTDYETKTTVFEGQKYRIEKRNEAADDSDWKIKPSIHPDYMGHHPTGSDEAIPDWIETPLDTAVGTLNTVAGVAVALDDIREAYAPDEGLDREDQNTWEWANFNGGGFGWTQMGHSQRFAVEVPKDVSNSSETHVYILTGGKTSLDMENIVIDIMLSFNGGSLVNSASYGYKDADAIDDDLF